MGEIIIQATGLIASVGAIYLGFHNHPGFRRLGALLGLFIATPINGYLTYNGAWSVFLLTLFCGVIYLKTANLPELLKRLR